jgi:hypothetical protein
LSIPKFLPGIGLWQSCRLSHVPDCEAHEAMEQPHHETERGVGPVAIMEDIITNFELASTRLLRICPVCNKFQDKPTTWQKNSRC